MGSVQIPGDLRVVAGDMQGDSIGSWVKTLMADAFYWADNDLVVQTGSMYGGVPRAAGSAAGGASFLLDRGAKVNYFNYFANPTTVDGIVGALLENAPPAFAAIGPLSWRGESAEGTRGGVPANDPTRPAVFVLPGILGSNLKVGDKRVWLGFAFLNGLLQLRWDPATADNVQPDGPVKGSYEGLIDRLAETHAVFPFAFDWRRPIEDEAKRLAVAVEAQLDARAASGAAGAHRRAFDGRPGGAHDADRVAQDLEPPDGPCRRPPADARRAQRGLVGTDADPLGRRQLRQCAGRLRITVPQRRGTQDDGRHAGPARDAGGPARPGLGPGQRREMGGAGQGRQGRPGGPQHLAPARSAEGRVRLERAAAAGARCGNQPAPQARRPGGRARRHQVEDRAGGGPGAVHAHGLRAGWRRRPRIHRFGRRRRRPRDLRKRDAAGRAHPGSSMPSTASCPPCRRHGPRMSNC